MAVAWSGAEDAPSPPEILPAAPSPWWWLGVGADVVATCVSPGTWAGPEGRETVGAPRPGPCPTASVGNQRTGCAVIRMRRERASREGGGSTGRTAAQTRIAEISRKLGLAVEGGLYPSWTHPH